MITHTQSVQEFRDKLLEALIITKPMLHYEEITTEDE